MQWPPWYMQVSSDHRLVLPELEHISSVPKFGWMKVENLPVMCQMAWWRKSGWSCFKHLHSLNQTSPSEKITTKTAIQHVLHPLAKLLKTTLFTVSCWQQQLHSAFCWITFWGPWDLPSSLRPLVLLFSPHDMNLPSVEKASKKWWKHYLLEALSPAKNAEIPLSMCLFMLETHMPFNQIITSWPFLIWGASPTSPPFSGLIKM